MIVVGIDWARWWIFTWFIVLIDRWFYFYLVFFFIWEWVRFFFRGSLICVCGFIIVIVFIVIWDGEVTMRVGVDWEGRGFHRLWGSVCGDVLGLMYCLVVFFVNVVIVRHLL